MEITITHIGVKENFFGKQTKDTYEQLFLGHHLEITNKTW